MSEWPWAAIVLVVGAIALIGAFNADVFPRFAWLAHLLGLNRD